LKKQCTLVCSSNNRKRKVKEVETKSTNESSDDSGGPPGITVENALEKLETKYKGAVRKQALEWIDKKARKVFLSKNFVKAKKSTLVEIIQRDDLAIKEIRVFEALVRWGEANGGKKEGKVNLEAMKATLKDLLPLVRWPLLKSKELASIVVLSGLEQDQMLELYSYIAQKEAGLSPKLPSALEKANAKERKKPEISFTWDPIKKGKRLTLSNKNMVVTKGESGWNEGSLVCGTKLFTGGDHYWELTLVGQPYTMCGVAIPEVQFDQGSRYSSSEACFVQAYTNSPSYGSLGTRPSSNFGSNSWISGDVLGLFLTENKTNKLFDLFLYKNRLRIGQLGQNIPLRVVAACELCSTNDNVTLNPRAKKPD